VAERRGCRGCSGHRCSDQPQGRAPNQARVIAFRPTLPDGPIAGGSPELRRVIPKSLTVAPNQARVIAFRPTLPDGSIARDGPEHPDSDLGGCAAPTSLVALGLSSRDDRPGDRG